MNPYAGNPPVIIEQSPQGAAAKNPPTPAPAPATTAVETKGQFVEQPSSHILTISPPAAEDMPMNENGPTYDDCSKAGHSAGCVNIETLNAIKPSYRT